MRHRSSGPEYALLNPGAAEERVDAARASLEGLQQQYKRDRVLAPDPGQLKHLKARISEARAALDAAQKVQFASLRRERARSYLRSLGEIPRAITQREASPFAKRERIGVRDAMSLLRVILREPAFEEAEEAFFVAPRLDFNTLFKAEPQQPPRFRPRPQEVVLLGQQPAWVQQAAFYAIRGLGPALTQVDAGQLQNQVFTDWAVQNLRLFGKEGRVKSLNEKAKKRITKEMRALAAPTVRELKAYHGRLSDMPEEMRDIFAYDPYDEGEVVLTRDEGTRWPVLDELKKGTEVDQLRASLVETHLALPGKGLPLYLTGGQRQQAAADAVAYHGLAVASEGVCPTCVLISKQSRIQGVNPVSLGSLMNWWAITRQARTPVVVG